MDLNTVWFILIAVLFTGFFFLEGFDYGVGMLLPFLGKGDLEIEIASHGVRLAPKIWAGFWADLVHVVRNAVDHGLESPVERKGSGKAERPKLRLVSAVVDRKLVVEIEDFGRGLDWQALKTAAQKLGLPSATEKDLIEAMFAAELSTTAEVTTISGRGVGLSAVRQQVNNLNGQITVVSKTGQGTCFRFIFALPDLGPRFGVDATGEDAAA